MQKIVNVAQAVKIAQDLRQKGKSIVLAGGCFDILHIGHILFLEKARKQGDVFFVFLESDESIRKQKGSNRPINTQADRAAVLSALSCIDYVILLPLLPNDLAYDIIVNRIKPRVIATTKNDPYRYHKVRQAKHLGGKVIDVIDLVSDTSTTKVAKLLEKEL